MRIPLLVNVPTTLNLSESEMAEFIERLLIKKYEIPMNDFDMETYKVKGSWVIGGSPLDAYEAVETDCGNKIFVVSFNEDAALLFDAARILRGE